MAYTTMKAVLLLILIAASTVPTSAARIGTLSPSLSLSSSVSADAPEPSFQIDNPTSKKPTIFDYVRDLIWHKRDTDVLGHQAAGSPAFTSTTDTVVITTIIKLTTETPSTPITSAPPPPSGSPITLSTQTFTDTVSGTLVIYTSIITVQTQLGTLSPISLSTQTISETVAGTVVIHTSIITSRTSIVIPSPSSFVCTETFCTPASSAFSWSCPGTAGCAITTTVASYSCSSGILCTLIPVTTTLSCSNPLLGNLCSTRLPLTSLPSSGQTSASSAFVPSSTGASSVTSASPGSAPSGTTSITTKSSGQASTASSGVAGSTKPSSQASTASSGAAENTKTSNQASTASSGAAGSTQASSNVPAAAQTTAASGSTCSDASCCPNKWACPPTNTPTANLLSGYACPPPGTDVIGLITATSTWDIACVPSSLSALVTESSFGLIPDGCPPYKTCTFPSLKTYSTIGSTGGTTATALQSLVGELPCSGLVPICTSVWPSLTRLSKPLCMYGEVVGSGYPQICDKCTSMNFPADCGTESDNPYGKGTLSFCACSTDATGLAQNSVSNAGGASDGCLNYTYTTTTEVSGGSAITTSFNPNWATCLQVDCKKNCPTTIASCCQTVSYGADSSLVTWEHDGKTHTSWIFWWSCRSKLCDVSFWKSLINAFCRFVGICHIPSVDGDGFSKPPWPHFPPIPDPADFTSDPEGEKNDPTSGDSGSKSVSSTSNSASSSTASSSSSCSEITVTDIIVYCFNTTISGGVFTTGCSSSSSFKASGCEPLTPITTYTTESFSCSTDVITVTDVGVGCFNITDSVGSFTQTCNQTSTYLSTGCKLKPTTETSTGGAICSLSPNYSDPAIMSDLATWLAQFPLTLPPDTVNLPNVTTSASTPNATLPGWKSVRLITTVVTGTNPSSVATEVLSESVDLWGGVTSVISGSLTEYISATSTSIVGEATISTLQPSTVTTITDIITTVLSGQDVVVSEVLVIYNATKTFTTVTEMKTTTEILGGETSTTSVPISTISGFDITTTDKYGNVWSRSDILIGGTTIIVTQVVISTVNVPTFTPPNAASTTTTSSNTKLSSSSFPTPMTAGFTTCSLWDPVPSVLSGDDKLECAFDTSADKIKYDSPGFDWANPIGGVYWLLLDDIVKSHSYIQDFCSSVYGSDADDWRIQGPDGCGPSVKPLETALYTNVVRRSYSGRKNVVADTFNDTNGPRWSGVNTADLEVTISIEWDALTCGPDQSETTTCQYALNQIDPNTCRVAFIDEILRSGQTDDSPCLARGNAVTEAIAKENTNLPNSGGSYGFDCLKYTIAAVHGPAPVDCPKYLH